MTEFEKFKNNLTLEKTARLLTDNCDICPMQRWKQCMREEHFHKDCEEIVEEYLKSEEGTWEN